MPGSILLFSCTSKLQRYEVVNGVVEVEGVTKDDAAETAAEEKGVPDFWFNAMKNHEILAEEVRPCIFLQ